jgi:ApbE superfamily uncharacterized protein (UPF0280 family)
MYQPRSYRHWVKDKELVAFKVTVKETDLYIRARSDLKRQAHELVLKYRDILEEYIKGYPSFLTSLEPVTVADDAPQIVTEMAEAAQEAGVGPMAAVAGAIAEAVGSGLLDFSPEVIVENGGDIYLKSLNKRLIGIYAGQSPLTGQLGLEINGGGTPLGICTSSGTVGHSLSFGQADAVIVLSSSTALADAAATAIGNRILKPQDIPGGIEFARSLRGLKGVIIIQGEEVGLWGEVKLRQIAVEA